LPQLGQSFQALDDEVDVQVADDECFLPHKLLESDCETPVNVDKLGWSFKNKPLSITGIKFPEHRLG
jgi:hypothetical protein